MNDKSKQADPVHLELSDDFVLTYLCGAEYDPSSPIGHYALTVLADGGVRLDNRRRGQARSWMGAVGNGTVATIIALLNTARFPVVPAHRIPPGATRSLLVQGQGRVLRTPAAGFYEALDLPGYKQLYHLLDSITVETSQGALKVVANPRSGLVHIAAATRPAGPL
jgi:hypothetical protein